MDRRLAQGSCQLFAVQCNGKNAFHRTEGDSCPASWIQDQLFYNDSPPPWTTHAHQWARRAPPPFPCPPPLPTHSPAGSLSPLNAPVSAIRNKYDF